MDYGNQNFIDLLYQSAFLKMHIANSSHIEIWKGNLHKIYMFSFYEVHMKCIYFAFSFKYPLLSQGHSRLFNPIQ